MKYRIPYVARDCLQNKNRQERGYIYCKMAANWRQSRHCSWKFAVCFDGMKSSNRVAYVEPNEIENMVEDDHKWKFHIFTRIVSEKEMILTAYLRLYEIFKEKQQIVETKCEIVWRISADVTKIILDYSRLRNKYAPPKMTKSKLKLMRDEPHICITDQADWTCVFCTIYHYNVSLKIDQFNDPLNKMHKRTSSHKRAVRLAKKYYNECDYC